MRQHSPIILTRPDVGPHCESAATRGENVLRSCADRIATAGVDKNIVLTLDYSEDEQAFEVNFRDGAPDGVR